MASERPGATDMPAQPKAGDVIDGFRLGERLHVGGMAVIHRLEGPKGPLPLVMKIPILGIGEPASNVTGFEVERLVLGVLQGPHVPALACSGDLADCPYLVMEYLDGATLEERVPQAPWPADEVARIGAAVATALHDLHRQGVLHLDLKPANVMFRADGTAVLIDLGLAHPTRYPDLLAEEYRTPMGAWPYMAPEQVVGRRCDPRSDIFALGAMLYELATGRLPFGTPESLAGLRRRLTHEPQPPRAWASTIPAWLQEVILHCLERDAARRPATAAQIAFDLMHHDQVVVGERGQRLDGPGWLQRWRQRLRSRPYVPAPCPDTLEQMKAAPIVAVAVATGHTNEAMFEALRDAAQRALAARADSRLACITVVPPEPVQATPEASAANQRIRQLLLLRQWARPLQLPDGRLTFHVLESSNPVSALLEHARINLVDQLIVGASARGMWGRGGAAAQLVADAPCNVTVVRVRAADQSPVA